MISIQLMKIWEFCKIEKQAHDFKQSLNDLDEKTKSNLKLLKETILEVNSLFLFQFLFFSQEQGNVYKHLTFVLAYVTTNNVKFTLSFLTMNIWQEKTDNKAIIEQPQVFISEETK